MAIENHISKVKLPNGTTLPIIPNYLTNADNWGKANISSDVMGNDNIIPVLMHYNQNQSSMDYPSDSIIINNDTHELRIGNHGRWEYAFKLNFWSDDLYNLYRFSTSPYNSKTDTFYTTFLNCDMSWGDVRYKDWFYPTHIKNITPQVNNVYEGYSVYQINLRNYDEKIALRFDFDDDDAADIYAGITNISNPTLTITDANFDSFGFNIPRVDATNLDCLDLKCLHLPYKNCYIHCNSMTERGFVTLILAIPNSADFISSNNIDLGNRTRFWAATNTVTEGSQNRATGSLHHISGYGNIAAGFGSYTHGTFNHNEGDYTSIYGLGNTIISDSSSSIGSSIIGSDNSVHGTYNNISGRQNIIIGQQNNVVGDYNRILGERLPRSDDFSQIPPQLLNDSNLHNIIIPWGRRVTTRFKMSLPPETAVQMYAIGVGRDWGRSASIEIFDNDIYVTGQIIPAADNPPVLDKYCSISFNNSDDTQSKEYIISIGGNHIAGDGYIQVIWTSNNACNIIDSWNSNNAVFGHYNNLDHIGDSVVVGRDNYIQKGNVVAIGRGLHIQDTDQSQFVIGLGDTKLNFNYDGTISTTAVPKRPTDLARKQDIVLSLPVVNLCHTKSQYGYITLPEFTLDLSLIARFCQDNHPIVTWNFDDYGNLQITNIALPASTTIAGLIRQGYTGITVSVLTNRWAQDAGGSGLFSDWDNPKIDDFESHKAAYKQQLSRGCRLTDTTHTFAYELNSFIGQHWDVMQYKTGLHTAINIGSTNIKRRQFQKLCSWLENKQINIDDYRDSDGYVPATQLVKWCRLSGIQAMRLTYGTTIEETQQDTSNNLPFIPDTYANYMFLDQFDRQQLLTNQGISTNLSIWNDRFEEEDITQVMVMITFINKDTSVPRYYTLSDVIELD